MERSGKSLLDWLKTTFHAKIEPPIEVEELENGLTLQQGPHRTRLYYVARIVAEALVYGAVVSALLFLLMLFGRGHAGSSPSLSDRLYLGYHLAINVGPACAAAVFPVLLLIRRGELDWSRLKIAKGSIRLEKGKWFGAWSTLALDAPDIADLDVRIECTPHLDVAAEQDLLDLTVDSSEHFETFAVGLPPDTARDFATRANELLAG